MLLVVPLQNTWRESLDHELLSPFNKTYSNSGVMQ